MALRPAFHKTQGYLKHYFKEKIHFNDNPRYVTFKTPGLDYSGFDRNGHPSIFHILKLAVQVRIIGSFGDYDGNGSSMIELTRLFSETESTVFVAAVETTIYKDMYNATLPRVMLDAKVSLGNIGNGSLTFVTELFVCGETQPIMKQIKKLVFVNPSTRKPIVVPMWFKENLIGKGAHEGNDFRINRFEKPSRTFVYLYEITWADTDKNAHTNYASYVKIAIEALHKYLFLNSQNSKLLDSIDNHNAKPETTTRRRTWGGDVSVLKGLTETDVAKGVHRVGVIYLKECVEGDLVETHLWEDLDNSKKVNCSIEGSNGQTLCQISLEYFPPLSPL